MTKLANLHVTLSMLHPKTGEAASQNQTHTNPFGVSTMTKALSLTAALVVFVPVAAVFLHYSALMLA